MLNASKYSGSKESTEELGYWEVIIYQNTELVPILQELRMSKAIDVMVQHVENLKRMYEREHSELEETR